MGTGSLTLHIMERKLCGNFNKMRINMKWHVHECFVNKFHLHKLMWVMIIKLIWEEATAFLFIIYFVPLHKGYIQTYVLPWLPKLKLLLSLYNLISPLFQVFLNMWTHYFRCVKFFNSILHVFIESHFTHVS
jgi:hypothetical protein